MSGRATERRGRRRHYEHNEQACLFSWAKALEGEHGALRCLFAVPNAARRSPFQGRWLKDEGLRAGVPDVLLPVRSRDGRYIGLAMEFKAAGGRLSEAQRDWAARLREHGWRVEVCRSWIEAARAIIEHLGLNMEV